MEKLRAPLPGEAAEGLEVQGQDLRGLLLLGKPQGLEEPLHPQGEARGLGEKGPVVPPAPEEGKAEPRGVGPEEDPRVVLVAPGHAQVQEDGPSQEVQGPLQLGEGLLGLGGQRKAPRLLQDLPPSVEVGEGEEDLPRLLGDGAFCEKPLELGEVFAVDGLLGPPLQGLGKPRGLEHLPHEARQAHLHLPLDP